MAGYALPTFWVLAFSSDRVSNNLNLLELFSLVNLFYELDKATFGIFVAWPRREKGCTQKARYLSVSDKDVSKWETGLSTPELDKLLALRTCFRITLDDLVKDKEVPSKITEGEPAKVQQGRPLSNSSHLPTSPFPKKWYLAYLCVYWG